MASRGSEIRRRVVITGGAGFIGSHAVDRCLKEGYEVSVIDNLISGRLSNLSQHKNEPRLSVIEADIRDEDSTQSIYRGADAIIHLAALADIVPSIERPSDYHKSNVDGTFSVLESARKNGVSRVVYAASSSCYGIPELYPTPEEAAIRPLYPYALTKYLGERYALSWGKYYGMSVISLRFFNVYGPRVRTSGSYGAVFGIFLAQKLKGLPFTVVGDGQQKRDFTYVSDVVDAILRSLESTVSGIALNVGMGVAHSVLELVELLRGPCVYIPKRPGEPEITLADNRKIKSLMNWEPRVSFEEGVKKMCDQITDWQDTPVWTPKEIERATEAWFRYLK